MPNELLGLLQLDTAAEPIAHGRQLLQLSSPRRYSRKKDREEE